MKKTRCRTALKGAGAGVVLEGREGGGPWDGFIDPETGNTCVRRFMRWYRQRLELSLHQVEALTGLDRAYLRRLERRRIHLSLVVLWRWANGLHVNVDWVLRMARRQALERAAARIEHAGRAGGSPAAPCASPAAVAECPHAPLDAHAEPAPAVPPAADAALAGKPGGGAPENAFPAGGECPLGALDGFPEDLHFACRPENRRADLRLVGKGLENSFLDLGDFPLRARDGLPGCVLMALVS